jgi:hypothetical protein
MSSRTFRTILANILLAVAYLALVLDWLWLAIVTLPRLIETGKLDFLTTPPAPQPQIVPNDTVASSPLMWILVGIATLGVLVMTIVVLIRLPRAIVQTGQKVVAETAEAVIPALTHHKPLPATKKRVLSRRIMLAIQLTLSLLPLAVCLFLPAYHELTRQIIVTIAAWLSLVSLISFVLSWLVSPAPTLRTRSRASRG